MQLPTHGLEAFYEVAQAGSFSRAAKNLHITQSALSQRVLNLEHQLEMTLFIRDPGHLRLTEAGEALLRHCQIRSGLERELLQELKGAKPKEMGGTLRIGGFSSVMWSVVIPALAPLLRSNPAVHIEGMVRELRELPQLLRAGAIDFAVADAKIDRADFECKLLGYEENVMIEPVGTGWPEGRYIDHDADDAVTTQFLRRQGRTAKIDRVFLDDIYGLIAGVSAGLGRAVMPRHLLPQCHGVRVDTSTDPLKIPVYLVYYVQPFYTQLHHAVVSHLTDRAKLFLAPNKKGSKP